MDRGLETLAEARLLHAQVGREPADLSIDGHDRLADAVERMAEVSREVTQHGERRSGMLGDLLGHAVQGIEEEMRIELKAQFLELRAQGLGLGAHGMAVLDPPRPLRVDPEGAKDPTR